MFDYQLDNLHPAEKEALVCVVACLAQQALEVQQHDSRKINLSQLHLAFKGLHGEEEY